MRPFAALLAAAVLVALPAAAQDPVVFDPATHLTGYAEAHDGPHRALYDFGAFDRWKGQRVGADELAALRALWQAQQRRVASDAAALSSDPRRARLVALERHMSEHPGFKRVQLQKDAAQPPFVFYVQRPSGNARPVAERIAAWQPWLEALRARFVAEFVEPWGRTREVGAECLPLVLLHSSDDYRTCVDSTPDPDPHWQVAHYAPELRAVLAVAGLDENGAPHPSCVKGVLHHFARELLDQYDGAAGERPMPIWFVDGLADLHTRVLGSTPDPLAQPILDHDQMHWLAWALGDAEGKKLLVPMRRLVTLMPGERVALVRAAVEAGVPRPEMAVYVFSAQAAVLFYFLQHGAEGRYREALARYASAVFGGAHGWEQFVQAFGGTDIAELETEYREFVRMHAVARFPRLVEPKAEPGAQPGAQPEGGAAGAGAAAADAAGADAAGAAAPEGSKPLDLTPLRFGAGDWRPVVALALDTAARGELDAALRQLDQLPVAVAEDAAAQQATRRVARARERLEAVLALRRKMLAPGAFVVIDTGKRKARGRVTELADGSVVLEQSGRKQEVSLDDWSIAALRREARRGKCLDSEPGWLDPYLQLLEGVPVTRALLRLDGGGTSADELREDADGIEAMRGLVEPARQLAALASGEPPAEVGPARQRLDQLTALLAEHGAVDFVQVRRDTLLAYAERLLTAAFLPTDPECLGIHGTLRQLESGSVQMTYDFADPTQLADFRRDDQAFPDFRKFYEDRAVGDPSVVIDSGKLVANGAVSVVFPLELAAPLTIRCTVAFGESTVFLICVCHDGHGSLLYLDSASELHVFDAPTGLSANSDKRVPSFYPGRPYTYELRHDGKRAENWFSGDKIGELDNVGQRTRGEFLVWVHAPAAMEIHRLEIEARLDDQALAAARTRWVARRLAALRGDD